MKTCIVIPVYNHENSLPSVIAAIKRFGLKGFIVDDGSSERCRRIVEDCVSKESTWLTLIVRAENGGKGAAVGDAFKAATAQGFTHALQIDADGQHCFDDIPRFLQASRKQPGALIAGLPVFGNDAPKSRLYGRRISNFWVAVNTLSLAIGDAMCGFRLYPLAPVEAVCAEQALAQRMDFDIDIIVRLRWLGTPIVNLPTTVQYPLDGVSHFRLWRDNAMISMCHARLFYGMLKRLPRLLARRWK